VKGTTNTRREVAVEDRLPEPITWTLTVVGLLQPAETVLLPLSSRAPTTIVAAGVVPVPWYDRVTVMCAPSTMLKPVTVASIETLAVEQDYRRQGIATSLLTALFEAFKEKGIDLATLSVPVVEIAAMRLYGKMGFELRAQFLWKRFAT
jgi:ribosomal protein S18 acetylase RimI-like enzyme